MEFGFFVVTAFNTAGAYVSFRGFFAPQRWKQVQTRQLKQRRVAYRFRTIATSAPIVEFDPQVELISHAVSQRSCWRCAQNGPGDEPDAVLFGGWSDHRGSIDIR
jgi:hypothetical protein